MTALDPVAAEWRERFVQTVESIDDDPAPIILQSGGMDSMTILAAHLALGRRPRLVSFSVGGSEYADLSRVRRIAAEHDLPLLVVEIERTERQLVDDIRWAIDNGATNKTHVQCFQPIDHMARRIRSEWGPSVVWMGTGGIGEDSRSCVVAWKQHGEEAAMPYRRKNLVYGGLAGGATVLMHRACRVHGHSVAEPYVADSFAPFSLSLPLAEINSPRQKGIALRAFPEFYALGLWAKNSSLQVGAGVRGWHDTLLASPVYNPQGFKRIIAVYNRINEVHDVADHHA